MSEFKKKYLKILLICVAIIAVLAIAFFAGGENSNDNKTIATEMPTQSAENSIVFSETHELMESDATEAPSESPTENPTAAPTTAPSATPVPISVNETMHIDMPSENVCTVSVSCADIDKDKLSPEKQSILPADGMILKQTSVSIKDGESVFDLLQRVLTEQKIHFVATKSPLGGKYISAIGNLFEKDGGETSGWGFKVNGEFPTVSAAEIKVKNGDVIEWIYFQ